MTGLELIAAGLIVGILVGATGMGAGSLMAPVLISVFSVSAVAAVGTDLLYSAGTKLVGGARHLTLRTVNVELGLWMAAGSVPAARARRGRANRLAASDGAAIQSDMKVVIGVALMLVAITVAVRTFVTMRGLWDASQLPTDADIDRNHRFLALVIGAVFGFIFGLTSVGAGAFFGMALVTVFPALGTTGRGHRPLPRSAGHVRGGRGLVLPAAVDAPLEHRVPHDRVDPRHPDRVAAHCRAAREGAARLARERARALQPEDAGRVLTGEFQHPLAFPTSSVILVGFVVITGGGEGQT